MILDVVYGDHDDDNNDDAYDDDVDVDNWKRKG